MMKKQKVGPYEIERILGHSARSRVYLAAGVQPEGNRRVAVKVFRAGDTGEHLRRFRRERQILARLDHPQIARLYDAGMTLTGKTYFVMEAVRGLPADVYCDRRRLSVRQRLELFLAVCHVVQHAHRHLVVHNNLRPGNVLVLADGTVKLLDFGRCEAPPPEVDLDYMSPELIRGRPISVATDVYTLGVLLHRLLTGRVPRRLEGRGTREIDWALREDPPRPSRAVLYSAEEQAKARYRTSRRKLSRQLDGNLDSIVLKALRESPQRRYLSVDQLAEDVRRHLRGWPLEHRCGPRGHLVARFFHRSRLALANV